ncbi:MAG: hypothetical protein R8G66_23450 [Cytophagales bacterium]|nr:hypothetical protein [Cytophagales bacterium]
MTEPKSKKGARFLFILNGILFLLGAYSLIDEAKFIHATVQGLAGIINLIMFVRTRNDLQQFKGHLMIFLMNVIICLMVAYDLHTSGKSYIQYVWLLSALFSMIAMVIFYRKERGKQ